MARLRYNGLSAALGASLTNSATSVTFAAALTHSNGTNVPTIAGSDYIPLSILDSNGHLSEIVYLTAYTATATTGTIVRGREGTTGVSHSSGDKIAHGNTVLDATPTYRLEPSPPIDHFDGNALSGWSFAGSHVSGDFVVGNSWATCASPRAAGSYVYQAPPGSWSTITARMFAIGSATGANFGIIAVDGTGAGVGASAAYQGTPDGTIVGVLVGGAYSSGVQSDASTKGTVAVQGFAHWLRLRKSGTSYFASSSLNGILWGPETAAAVSSATIARIGFGVWTSGTPSAWGVDWFDAS